MKNLAQLIFLSALMAVSCHKDSPAYPDCISNLIESQKLNISAVYRYNYHAEVVYDFNPEGICCDLANTIYASGCTVICVLNGLTGNQVCKGDTFYSKATDKTLVWKKY